MASKVRFTEGRVQALNCPPGKRYAIHLDTETPGLGVRITENGARSYVFEKRVHGVTMRVTIGDASSWPLKKAQQRARELAVMVEKGDDPRMVAAQKTAQAEAARVEAARADLVLREVWQAYIDSHKATWGARHLEKHIRLAHPGGEPKKKHGGKGLTKAGPLASLMSLRLQELTDERVAEWLKNEAEKRPTTVALAYRLLRALIRWCNDTKAYKGIISQDAYSAREVRKHVPTPRAKEGDCLQKEQLPSWFTRVRQLQNQVIAAYLQTLLITGPRREELEALRWDDVDFKWNSIVIHDKVEGERTIPLTTEKLRLVADNSKNAIL
jgi:integrase